MSDANPEDIRKIVHEVMAVLSKAKGFLPANVAIPLQSAHGKLIVAETAIDAWEAKNRLDDLLDVENDEEREPSANEILAEEGYIK